MGATVDVRFGSLIRLLRIVEAAKSGNKLEKRMPRKMPEINIAAAIIPAVIWYCGFVWEPGAYIIANELKYPDV